MPGRRLFRWLTGFVALLVLLALLALALHAVGRPRSARRSAGTSSPHRLGSGEQQVSARWCRSTARLSPALIAMLIAVPVSFGIALFLTEVAPNWMRGPVAAAIELLAGIPVDHLRHVGPVRVRADHGRNTSSRGSTTTSARWPLIGALLSRPADSGIGMLTAGIVLAIMVIPFISSVMREVFLTVPTRSRNRPTRSARRPGKWSGTSCCPTRARR